MTPDGRTLEHTGAAIRHGAGPRADSAPDDGADAERVLPVPPVGGESSDSRRAVDVVQLAREACRYGVAANHVCFPAAGLCLDEKRARDYETPAIRRAIPGASGLGIMSMVGVGWAVWSREQDGEGFPVKGGTVVSVVSTTDDDGATHRAFDVLAWPFGRLRIATLTEDEVDVDASQLPTDSVLRSDFRRLADRLTQTTRKRGAFDTDVFRITGLLHTLAGVIQGTR